MSNVLTGARALFQVENTSVAIASNCTYTWAHNNQPIEVIGRETVAEHAEIGTTVEFTCDTFRVFNKNAHALGLQPQLKNFLAQPELTVTLVDKITNQILLKITGIKLNNRSGTLPARGAWTESLSFNGLVASDEGNENLSNTEADNTPPWP